MFDYHIHTRLCGHATGTMEQYILIAINKGFDEMGFSAHIPVEYLPETVPRESYGMPESKLGWYFSEIKKLQKKFNDQIIIKIGMEIDYMAWNQNSILKFVENHIDRLDYIFGSIHMINTSGIGIWSVDDNKFRDNYDIIGVDKVYNQYLDELTDLINTGVYDIIAHFDLVKKFGFRPSDKASYLRRVENVLDLIKSKGMIIECSTAGLRKKIHEIYPEEEILKKIIAREIPMILSSDAHKPEEVGYKFRETIKLLRDLGLKKLCKISKKEKKMVPL